MIAKRDSQRCVQELETVAEAAKYIVIGSVIRESEERIHVDREIRRDLIDQAGVECADPLLTVAGAHSIVEFHIAAQISDDRAREADWILPLHTHVAAARFVENVDPRLGEQCETPWQGVIYR